MVCLVIREFVQDPLYPVAVETLSEYSCLFLFSSPAEAVFKSGMQEGIGAESVQMFERM